MSLHARTRRNVPVSRSQGKYRFRQQQFADVDANAYYASAVKWAVDNGITNGISSSLFGPDSSCTRAQIVTFLYRMYQASKQYNTDIRL